MLLGETRKCGWGKLDECGGGETRKCGSGKLDECLNVQYFPETFSFHFPLLILLRSLIY